MRGGIWWINFSFGRKPESLKAFVSGMIGDLGNHRGCREGGRLEIVKAPLFKWGFGG